MEVAKWKNSHTMCSKTISSPASGDNGGTTGSPLSKKSMGDFTGSNLEGAHHLTRSTKANNESKKTEGLEVYSK